MNLVLGSPDRFRGRPRPRLFYVRNGEPVTFDNHIIIGLHTKREKKIGRLHSLQISKTASCRL